MSHGVSKGLLQTWRGLECDYTPLLIDSKAYDERCKPNKGPCFGIANQKDVFLHTKKLKHAHFEPWLEPLNMTNEVIVRDGNALCKYCHLVQFSF